MSTKVSVDNFDEQRLGLRKELNRLTQKLAASKVKESKGINLSLDVNGMADLMQSLLKLMELLTAIDYQPQLNLPEIKLPEIRVPDVNIPEIKVPSIYVPPANVSVSPEVNVDVRGIIDALDNLKFLSDRPNKPLSVRLSDGQKFQKAIQELTKATEAMGVVYSGSSGLTTDDMRVVSGRSGTDKLYGDNGATYTPKFSAISASSNGDNTIVAAVPTKKIRVLQLDLMASGTVNAKFKSSTTSDLTGLSYLIANTGIVRPFSPYGWFETVAGELLNLNLSAGQAVGGSLLYIEV
jgi:hypothetical protein